MHSIVSIVECLNIPLREWQALNSATQPCRRPIIWYSRLYCMTKLWYRHIRHHPYVFGQWHYFLLFWLPALVHLIQNETMTMRLNPALSVMCASVHSRIYHAVAFGSHVISKDKWAFPTGSYACPRFTDTVECSGSWLCPFYFDMSLFLAFFPG